MTTERILEASRILGMAGRPDLSKELSEVSFRYRWRRIAEMHEDFGQCVLMDIDDPGSMRIGNNLDSWYHEANWTHFSQIVPLSYEEAEEMRKCAGGAA